MSKSFPITVLLADPNLEDLGWNEHDDELLEELKIALSEVPNRSFTYFDNHAVLFEEFQLRPPALVFNLCDEGFKNQNEQEAHLVSLMEMLEIPFTGTASRGLTFCRDKHLVALMAKDAGVRVPYELVIDEKASLCDLQQMIKCLPEHTFPYIVKPRFGDGSLGIDSDSIVKTPQDLLENLMSHQGQAMLVQEFLSGMEITVAAVGNIHPGLHLEILPILQIDYSNLPPDLPQIQLYDAKRNLIDNYWQLVSHPKAELTSEIETGIEQTVARLFKILELQDYARFDFRFDSTGHAVLLDVNPNNWIGGKFKRAGELGGYTWPQLLEKVISAALDRIKSTYGEDAFSSCVNKNQSRSELLRQFDSLDSSLNPELLKYLCQSDLSVGHNLVLDRALASILARLHSKSLHFEAFRSIARDHLHQRHQISCQEPRADQREVIIQTEFGTEIRDEFLWMGDEDMETSVTNQIDIENDYVDKKMSHLDKFRDTVWEELQQHYKVTENIILTTPSGGQLQKSVDETFSTIFKWRKNESSDWRILVDEMALNKNVACNSETVKLNRALLSPDENLLAYSVDSTGEEIFDIHFVEVQTGVKLVNVIKQVSSEFVWTREGAGIVYTQGNSEGSSPSSSVYVHDVIENADREIYCQDDASLVTNLSCSSSYDFIFINCSSQGTSHILAINADIARIDEPARVIWPMQQDVFCKADHKSGLFIFMTNQDNATNFKILAFRETERGEFSDKLVLLSCRQFVLIEDFEIFGDYLAVFERSNAMSHIRIVNLANLSKAGSKREPKLLDHYVAFPDQFYAIWRASEGVDASNPNIPQLTIAQSASKTPKLKFFYSTLTLPPQLVVYDANLRNFSVSSAMKVPNHVPEEFVVERKMALSSDGTQVPITLVYHRSTSQPSPLLLHGYGAYGSSVELRFQPQWLPLLHRGVTCAIAHVRGGSEFGSAWYHEGRREYKTNTFNDFIACADFLIETGITTQATLAISGRSAGGLLIGAVLNMRPSLCHVALLKVPFVDVVTTLRDTSVPWTCFETEEWGDISDKSFFSYISSYCPYTNIQNASYPHIFCVSAWNDPYVNVREPLKWVSRLRNRRSGSTDLLFRTNFGGHLGSFGENFLEDVSLEIVFLLYHLGISCQSSITSPSHDRLSLTPKPNTKHSRRYPRKKILRVFEY